MCQLSFVNFNNKVLNTTYAQILASLNTRTSNKDGFGIFNGKEIIKDGREPSEISDISKYFSSINSLPLLMHVRLATLINGFKIVCDEKAHPFESDSFILMHNGSLELKDEKAMKSYEDRKIDSEIFLEYLQREYDQIKNSNEKSDEDIFVRASNLAMKYFHGKFAFLIYEKPRKIYWVIRGRTAELHVLEFRKIVEYRSEEREVEKEISKKYIDKDGKETIKKVKERVKEAVEIPITESIGFVLNTNISDLRESGHIFKLFAQSFLGQKIVSTVVKELEKETVYSIDYKAKKLIPRGKLEEENKPSNFTPAAPRNYGGYHYSENYSYGMNRNASTSNSEKTLLEFQKESNLSVKEIDELFLLTIGIPILCAQALDIKVFTDVVIPELAKYTSKNKRKVWDKFTELSYNPISIYGMTGINFPYMLNNTSDLKSALSSFKKKVESERRKQ